MALEFSIEIDDKGTPKLRKFQGEVKKTGKDAKEANVSFEQVAKGLAAAGTAAVAGAGSLVYFANSVSENVRELSNLSKVAGTSVNEFQKYAAGARTVGIEQEKLADIFKDTSDKFGDFIATGGGAAADFFENIAPQVGVTAEEFANLSGPQALQKYYSSLEKANLNQAEMTFYMEAIASDATNLIPLLAEGGKQFGNLGDQAQKAGNLISDDLLKSTEEYENSLFNLKDTAEGSLLPIAEEMLPLLSDSFVTLTDAIQIAGPGIKQVFESLNPILKGTLDLLNDTALGWGQIIKQLGDAIDFKKELERVDDETTDEEIKNLLKKMEANKKAYDEEKKQVEETAKRAEQVEARKQRELAKKRKKAREDAKREAERHSKELIRIAKEEAKAKDALAQQTLERRKAANESYEQLRRETVQKEKEAEKELTNFFKSENELRRAEIKETYDQRVEILGATAQVEKARMMEIAELQREIDQQRRDSLANQFNEIGQFAGLASQTLANLNQMEQNRINQSFDERSVRIQEEYNERIKAAEGNASQQEKIARERDEKLKRLEVKREKDLQRSAKKTAQARKRAAQLEAIVNTAAAVTKALPNIPLSIAVGVAGASQVALIESQQFFKGGMAGESGQENISVGENGREFVVSAGGTRQAGEAALQDINNGRLEDAANRLLAQSNRPSGGITLQIQGGVIDEQFLENSLIPRMREFERRL